MAEGEWALMPQVTTNIQVIKPSRKKPLAGDIFAILLPDHTYIFGRVIKADISDLRRTPMPGAYLIYVYDRRLTSPEPDVSDLSTDHLLMPPVFINKMPWNKGYFATVAHVELEQTDLLSSHCFWSVNRRMYVDENRSPVQGGGRLCGDWALSSYRWLDDKISDALGIPRVP